MHSQVECARPGGATPLWAPRGPSCASLTPIGCPGRRARFAVPCSGGVVAPTGRWGAVPVRGTRGRVHMPSPAPLRAHVCGGMSSGRSLRLVGFPPKRHAACRPRTSASCHTQRAGHVGMRPRVGPLLARNPASGGHLPSRHKLAHSRGPGARHTGHPCQVAHIVSPRPGVRVLPRVCDHPACEGTFFGVPPAGVRSLAGHHLARPALHWVHQARVWRVPPRPCGLIGPSVSVPFALAGRPMRLPACAPAGVFQIARHGWARQRATLAPSRRSHGSALRFAAPGATCFPPLRAAPGFLPCAAAGLHGYQWQPLRRTTACDPHTASLPAGGCLPAGDCPAVSAHSARLGVRRGAGFRAGPLRHRL